MARKLAAGSDDVGPICARSRARAALASAVNPAIRDAPTYRAWGYPVLPIVFIISTAVIVANQLIADPWESITGLAIVLAGLPFYYLRVRGRTTTRELHADH